MNEQAARVAEFRRLHDSGTFVMPNPWDVGTARALEQLGFRALATTSAGLAWTLGHTDYELTLEETLRQLRALVSAVDVPVSADFQGGFADDPDHVAEHVRLAAETGIAGISIEDSSTDTPEPLYEFELAVERVRAARQTNDDSGTGIVLTGRSEGFVVGLPDLAETIRRLTAYAEAGADCLYAPYVDSTEQISVIVAAVSPTPVNMLIRTSSTSVTEAAAVGVRRISTGGHLARVAWGAFLDAAREIADSGTFSALEQLPNVEEILRS